MVADLDGLNLARIGRIDLGLKAAGLAFDIVKRSQHLSARVEDRCRVSLAGDGFLPCGEQGVVRISSLARRPGARLSSPLVSKHESGHSS